VLDYRGLSIDGNVVACKYDWEGRGSWANASMDLGSGKMSVGGDPAVTDTCFSHLRRLFERFAAGKVTKASGCVAWM